MKLTGDKEELAESKVLILYVLSKINRPVTNSELLSLIESIDDMNYFYFGIMCLTLSYAMATVRRISNGVFPCILLHCFINGLSAVFLFDPGITSSVTALVVTVAISLIVIKCIPKSAKENTK